MFGHPLIIREKIIVGWNHNSFKAMQKGEFYYSDSSLLLLFVLQVQKCILNANLAMPIYLIVIFDIFQNSFNNLT